MSGKVIAVANMKGGVGKTATVVALAEALAADEGKPVLVIDLDAQANASICIAGEPGLKTQIERGRTIEAFIEDADLEHGSRQSRQPHLEDYVATNISDVSHRGSLLPISLLGSTPRLRILERELVFRLTKADYSANGVIGQLLNLMMPQLKRATGDYAYVIIDCAPGISALNEVCIRLADLVIVPTIPDFLSTYGLQAFCKSMWRGRIAALSSLPRPQLPPHVLATRKRPTREHDRTLARMALERTADDPAFTLLTTVIPEATAIAEALAKTGTQPGFTDKWGQKAVQVMDEMMRETREALNGARS